MMHVNDLGKRILLLILLSFPQLIANVRNPIVLLKKATKEFLVIVQELFQRQDVSLPLCFLKYYMVIRYIAKRNTQAAAEFKDLSISLENAIAEIFSVSAVDDVSVLQKFLFPKSLTMANLEQSTYGNESILMLCISHDIKAIFRSSNIALLVNSILWKPSKKVKLSFFYLRYGLDDDSVNENEIDRDGYGDSNIAIALLFLIYPIDYIRRSICHEIGGFYKHSYLQLSNVKEVLLRLRYLPVGMLILEGISKAFTLWITSYIILNDHVSKLVQIGAVVMIGSTILYEIGQLNEIEQKFSKHFSSIWNLFDLVALSLLTWWMVDWFVHYYTTSAPAKVGLALSAIPQSLSLLQYLGIWKETGQLVAIVFAMIRDMFSFVVIFAFCILGYGITFQGLFPHSGYSSGWNTFLTLFSSTIGGSDFTSFENSGLDVLGNVLLVTYILFTLIILINLIIARMSNTHKVVSDRAQEEWAFTQVGQRCDYC
jgi:hypothetical protein